MTDTLPPAKADLAAVKQLRQQAWASRDFAVVAGRSVLVAEHLCDTADLHAGWRVLDVGTGSGNAAIAAAPVLRLAGAGVRPAPPPARAQGSRSSSWRASPP